MEQSVSATDRNWKKWAELDPYHGVLGRGFGVGDIEHPDVRARFFQQGEDHIARVLDTALQLGPLNYGSALDFGCGVGRLLRPLLNRFTSVAGVDISPEMLRLARGNCADANTLVLFETLDAVRAAGHKFDLIHTYIVMQHIRPVQGLPLMEKMFDLLRPGGTAAIHFTVGDLNTRRRLLNRMRYQIPPLHWLYNVTTRRKWNLPISEMNAYPLEQVLELFRRKLGDRFTGWSVDQGGHQGMMVIARKSAAS